MHTTLVVDVVVVVADMLRACDNNGCSNTTMNTAAVAAAATATTAVNPRESASAVAARVRLCVLNGLCTFARCSHPFSFVVLLLLLVLLWQSLTTYTKRTSAVAATGADDWFSFHRIDAATAKNSTAAQWRRLAFD